MLKKFMNHIKTVVATSFYTAGVSSPTTNQRFVSLEGEDK